MSSIAEREATAFSEMVGFDSEGETASLFDRGEGDQSDFQGEGEHGDEEESPAITSFRADGKLIEWIGRQSAFKVVKQDRGAPASTLREYTLLLKEGTSITREDPTVLIVNTTSPKWLSGESHTAVSGPDTGESAIDNVDWPSIEHWRGTAKLVITGDSSQIGWKDDIEPESAIWHLGPRRDATNSEMRDMKQEKEDAGTAKVSSEGYALLWSNVPPTSLGPSRRTSEEDPMLGELYLDD